jgi:hypothetical protein
VSSKLLSKVVQVVVVVAVAVVVAVVKARAWDVPRVISVWGVVCTFVYLGHYLAAAAVAALMKIHHH